jgi:hypothetical protein
MNDKLDYERQFDDVLEECVALVRIRKATIEECLERYPDLKEKLEPLLRTALVLEATPKVEPSPKFKMAARMRLMQKVGVPAVVAERRIRPRRIPMRLTAVSLAFLLILGGVAAASTNSLPDSFLYPIKRAIEKVRLATALNERSRASIYLSLAKERLEEAKAMVRARKTGLVRKTLREMNQETEEAYRSLQRVSGKDKEVLLTKLVSLSERQQAVLKRVIEQAPPEARAALEHALEVSQRGHERAKEALEKTKTKGGPPRREPPAEEKRDERGPAPQAPEKEQPPVGPPIELPQVPPQVPPQGQP